MWLALEINMLRFLPIMSEMEDFCFDNIIKYFLVQSLASITFIIFSLFRIINRVRKIELFVFLALSLKLGIAPFHRWFLSIVKNTSLIVIFLLSTIQKIIPVSIFSIINIWGRYLYLMININFLLLFTRGLFILRFNKILGLSRINNLMWLLLGTVNNIYRGYLFLFIYRFLLSGVLVLFLHSHKSVFFNIVNKNLIYNMRILFILISIGGLPPFLGFLRKVLILKQRSTHVRLIVLVILVFRALIILYYYIRFIFLSSRLSPQPIIINKPKISYLEIFYMVRILAFWLIIIYIV